MEIKKNRIGICKCCGWNSKPNLYVKMKGRYFKTGAYRDEDTDKLDFEGFLSPRVIEAFGRYMHKHRKQSDGKLRESDNWQKGMPKEWFMKSGFRHFFDWWKEHRNLKSREGMEDALCGLMFNVMGYLYEWLKENDKN